MTQGDDTDSLIFDARSKSNGRQSIFWLWLGSSYQIMRSRMPDFFGYESDLQRSYGAAKQIVIELWTIRTFLIKLNFEIGHFDKLLPNLKAFRDAIAHIDQRADGTIYTAFGLVRDWVITNTDQGTVELHLTSDLFEQIDGIVRSAAETA